MPFLWTRATALLCRPGLMTLMLTLLATDAEAQRRARSQSLIHGPLQIGVRVGRDFENHAWSLGGQVELPVGRNLELRPSGDVFFPKDGKTGWQLNGDGAIVFGQTLYAGGGVAFVHLDEGNTETGYNIFFGIRTPPRTGMRPFLEFRWTFVNDTSPFRLALGFGYPIGL
jgi:hypothetical protein